MTPTTIRFWLYQHISLIYFSLLLFFTIGLVIILWQKGGFFRYLSQQLAIFFSGLILATTLAVWLFAQVENWAVTPYPWHAIDLFFLTTKNSTLYFDWIICLLSAYSVILIAFIAKWCVNLSHPEHIFGKAHFAYNYEIYRAGLYGEQGIIVGKHSNSPLRVPGFEGALVVAPMGQGKTTAIAIPNLLEWPGSVVVNDLKGELYQTTRHVREKQFKNTCYRFAPSSHDLTKHKYNPFFYVSRDPKLRIRDLQLIAEILIPTERVGLSFWANSSRDLFLLLALYLLETQEEATLDDVHDLSKREDFFEWLRLIVTEEKIAEPVFYQNANSLLSADPEKTQKNILKDFHSRFSLLTDPIIREATSGNDFDFRLLRKEKMSIYIQIHDSDKARLQPILTLFWAQLIHVMTEHEPDPIKEPYAVLALLDEFGNMARINKLKDGVSFLRSYRIRTIILVQYLAQIISTYGPHDAKGFLNSKVKIAFTLNDLDDAKFISQCLGTKTVKVKTRSFNHGRHASSSQNVSFQSRALMTPDEIMQMKPDDALILLEAVPPVKAKKYYWYKEKKFNENSNRETKQACSK